MSRIPLHIHDLESLDLHSSLLALPIVSSVIDDNQREHVMALFDINVLQVVLYIFGALVWNIFATGERIFD